MAKVAFVDVDNTLWDFEGEMIRRMREILGDDKVPDVMTYWEQPEVLMGSKDEAVKIFNDMHACQHHFEPFDGAQLTLKALRRMKYHIVIATNRLPETRDSLLLWLDEWELPYDELWTNIGKEVLFDERKFDLVFDDAPYIINAAVDRGIETIALRYDYNKNITAYELKKFKDCTAVHEHLVRKMIHG